MGANQAQTLKQFLSLSQLARRCDVSAPRASRLVRSGVWVPDGQLDRTFVFDAARTDVLREIAVAAKSLVRAAA